MCNDAPPDLVLLATTTLLLAMRIIREDQAWKGFSQPSILAIGALFIFARALEETQAVEMLVRPVLGKPSLYPEAVLRLCLPTMLFSAFLNNTPIVAVVTP